MDPREGAGGTQGAADTTAHKRPDNRGGSRQWVG